MWFRRAISGPRCTEQACASDARVADPNGQICTCLWTRQGPDSSYFLFEIQCQILSLWGSNDVETRRGGSQRCYALTDSFSMGRLFFIIGVHCRAAMCLKEGPGDTPREKWVS